VSDGAAPGASDLLRRAARPLVAVLPAWLVARAIVIGAVVMAHLIVDRAHVVGPGAVHRAHQGLLGWDAGWYKAIAQYGYVALGHQSLRFFPLVPLVTRALAVLPGVSYGAALVFLANLSSLVGTALLYVLVRREGGEALARRSVWLLCLVPPAFVFVMGYAEGTLLVFTTACFLAIRPAQPLRTRTTVFWATTAAEGPGAALAETLVDESSPTTAVRPVTVAGWSAAAVFGFLAALTRPLGVLLGAAVAVEAVRWWRRSGGGERVASVVATLAPVAGICVFLGWSAAAEGDFFRPLRVQTQSGHHGGLSDPIHTLVHDASGLVHHHFGTALHVPWVLLVVALLVVCWWRLPASYGAFATAVVVVALSGTNLDSFERYALSAFPLVVAGATLLTGPRMERAVLVLAAVGMGFYALLAFLNILVP